MPQTLTTELLEADFADLATDFPCTVTFTEGAVSQTLPGTYGVMDESPVLSEVGYLAAYRLSVWVSSSRWTTKPLPGRIVAVNVTNEKTGAVTSTNRQVLAIGQDDGIIMRLVLGDVNA